jgi:hypothetical protein
METLNVPFLQGVVVLMLMLLPIMGAIIYLKVRHKERKF